MSNATPPVSPAAPATVAEARARLAASVSRYAERLAEVIGGFFVAAGVDPEVGAAALARAAERVRSGDASLAPDLEEPWMQLSDAVVLWWRDPEYVDDSGRPRPLPDAGPAPSLEALFARSIRPELRTRARTLLGQQAAVVRDGVWHYTGEYPVLRLGSEEGVHRLLTELSGWLGTYLHNQVLVDEPPQRRNFDGSAHVSDYPEAMVPELQSKLYRRLQSVLEEHDGYMTSVAARDIPGPRVRVGITAFMHTSAPHEPAPPALENASDAAAAPSRREPR